GRLYLLMRSSKVLPAYFDSFCVKKCPDHMFIASCTDLFGALRPAFIIYAIYTVMLSDDEPVLCIEGSMFLDAIVIENYALFAHDEKKKKRKIKYSQRTGIYLAMYYYIVDPVSHQNLGMYMLYNNIKKYNILISIHIYRI
ncbi:hypothetical protein ACJX0J_021010, partial [Zea mays]